MDTLSVFFLWKQQQLLSRPVEDRENGVNGYIHLASLRREISMNCLMSFISEGMVGEDDERKGWGYGLIDGLRYVFLQRRLLRHGLYLSELYGKLFECVPIGD
jgi:hypothetical protein